MNIVNTSRKDHCQYTTSVYTPLLGPGYGRGYFSIKKSFPSVSTHAYFVIPYCTKLFIFGDYTLIYIQNPIIIKGGGKGLISNIVCSHFSSF